MAMVGGLGGGVLCDLLLGTVPLVLVTPAYLYTVVGAALIGMFFGSVVERLHIVLAIVDTLALGLFTVVGASRALLFDLPIGSAILLGVVTGIGGGLILDLLAGDVPPKALRRGAPYASASLAGAALFTALTDLTGLSPNAVALGAIVLVAATRAIGLWRGWVTPGPIDLTPRDLRRHD